MGQPAGASWPGPLKALIPFAAGVLAAEKVAASFFLWPRGCPPGASIAVAFGFAGLLGVAVWGRRFRGPLLWAALVAGGAARAWFALETPQPTAFEAAARSGRAVAVRGRCERVEPRPSGSTRVLLRLSAVDAGGGWTPSGAPLVLSWPDSLPAPEEGGTIAGRARLAAIPGATNPGGWDGRRQFFHRGVRYRAFLRGPSDLLERRGAPFLSAERGLAGARRVMGASIDRRLSGFPGRFARVLLLGDRVAFRPEEEADFRRAGVTHILSVSGLHVGIVAATIQLLLGRRRRISALLISLAGIWGYTALVGAPSAAVRSAAMLSLVLLARHGRRPLSGPALLSGAVFLLLAADPMLLFDLGFLLSVMSVAGLLSAHGLLRSLAPKAGWPGPLRKLVEVFGLTFGAQAATAPITIPAWGDWPLVAPISNLLVVGLSDMLLVGGLLGLALDLVQPAASDRVFAVVWGLGRGIGAAVHFLAAHSPGVTGLARPPEWVPVALVSSLALFLVMRAAGSGRRWQAPAAAAFVGCFVLLLACPRRPPRTLRVTALDVGQGDATLVEFPDGATMLVDGGEGGRLDTGGRVIIPALRQARIRHLDAVVLTHHHQDHLGGLLAVVGAVPVRRLYDTGLSPADGESDRFRRLGWGRRSPPCLVSRGDTLLAGADYAVTALWPPRLSADDDHERKPDELNDLSIVLLIEWRGRRLLLCGDAEQGTEGRLLDEGGIDAVDYVKVGHHGSRTSSTERWVTALAPRIASVSVGARNRFRHPSRRVMERYLAHGVCLRRTDHAGAVRLTWGRGTIECRTWGNGLQTGPVRSVVALAPDGPAFP